MNVKHCIRCMRPMQSEGVYCPYCLREMQNEQIDYSVLPCGSTLRNGQFLVGKVLGKGGFGITYVGLNQNMDLKVAIKEFFPREMASRDKDAPTITWQNGAKSRDIGKKSFVKEARDMAHMASIPNVVMVHDIIENENNTAYIVMNYIEGKTLRELLEEQGRPLAPAEAINLLLPIVDALSSIHRNGMVHRDISPDNIMVDEEGIIWLLDLGAAKETAYYEEFEKKSIGIIKRGYSPIEQYEHKKIGTWSDVYAFCATLMFCITGAAPPDSRNRKEKDLLAFSDKLDDSIKAILERGLAMNPRERIQTMDELKKDLKSYLSRNPIEKEPGKGKSDTEYISDDPTEILTEQTEIIGEEPGKEVEKIDEIPHKEPIKPDPGKNIKWKNFLVAGVAIIAVLVAAFLFMPHGDSSAVMMGDATTVVDPDPNSFQLLSPEDLEALTQSNVFGSEYKRNQIVSISFLDSLSEEPEGSWDISYEKNGKVKAWVKEPNSGMYELYIAGKGGVVAPLDCKQLFAGYSNVEKIDFNGAFQFKNVTNMEAMFLYCTKLQRLDLSDFDTSQAKSMRYLFSMCYALESVDLSSFNTTNVTNFFKIFDCCYKLTDLNVSSFDTSNAEVMSNMFRHCIGLTSIDLSNFNTSKCKRMYGMFAGATNIKELDLNNFDTGNTETMSYMFSDCTALEKLNLKSFNTSKTKDMSHMFENTPSLQELDLSNFDRSSLTYTENMFDGTSAEIKGWGDITKVIDSWSIQNFHHGTVSGLLPVIAIDFCGNKGIDLDGCSVEVQIEKYPELFATTLEQKVWFSRDGKRMKYAFPPECNIFESPVIEDGETRRIIYCFIEGKEDDMDKVSFDKLRDVKINLKDGTTIDVPCRMSKAYQSNFIDQYAVEVEE